MKIILVGATGYLGPRLAGVLQSVRHEVTEVTRDATLRTNRLPEGVRVVGVKDYEPAALQHVLQGTDAVVNLAGANIGKGR
jgi:NAD dependent epimerase/dehydratase family enzyme